METIRKQHKLDERGFAAIVIAITLILVLSLITMGFAELMRHEQRSALDKHLSNQAFYAAESGVNDASKAIAAGYSQKKTACGIANSGSNVGVVGTQPGAAFLKDNNVGNDSSVSYTCLLIDPMPQTLVYSPEPGKTKAVELSGVDDLGAPARIVTLVISWQQEGGTINDATSFVPLATPGHPLPSNQGWTKPTGVVRMGLVPLTDNTSSDSCLTRDCLTSRSYVSFLYPRAGGPTNSTTNYPSPPFIFSRPVDDATNGPFIDGSCNSGSTIKVTSTATTAKMACNVQINGLVASDYLLTLKSFYRQNNIKITAFGSSGQLLHFKNAQTVVDSTGKAQDVLRRIQVRVPSKNAYDVPDNALDVMNGICKQLNLDPGTLPATTTGC